MRTAAIRCGRLDTGLSGRDREMPGKLGEIRHVHDQPPVSWA